MPHPYEQIGKATQHLAIVCDGAVAQDGVGFNGGDTRFGHQMAKVPYEDWTPAQAFAVWRMLQKYKRQIGDVGPEPAKFIRELKPSEKPGYFKVICGWEPEFQEMFSAVGGYYQKGPPKHWLLPVKLSKIAEASEWFVANGFELTPEVLEHFNTCRPSYEQPIGYFVTIQEESPFTLRFEWNLRPFSANEVHRNQFKARIGSRSYVPKIGWDVTVTSKNAKDVQQFLQDHSYTVPEGLYERLEGLAEQRELITQENKMLSSATTIDNLRDIPGMNPDLHLRDYQLVALELAKKTGRLLIADDMGLGKTPTSLAIVQEAQAYPALIICPASVKRQWKWEIERWLPGKSVLIVEGRAPLPTYTGYDFVIVNYDLTQPDYVLKEEVRPSHAGLWKVPFQAVVADEIHYVKYKKAARAKAVKQLMHGKKARIRLGLSGTITERYASELINPLDCIGVFTDMFSALPGDGNGAWQKYMHTFCGGRGQFGWNYQVSKNRPQLHGMLCESGHYLRRDKKEVLTELPEKVRVHFPVEVDLKAYDKARLEFLASADEEQMGGAIRLVEIETLMHAVEKAKVPAALTWIEEMLDDGKKLIFGYHHHDVGELLLKKLAKHKPAVIYGGQSSKQRDQEVQRFQTDASCRLLLASIQAANVGLNLQEAEIVATIAYRWNPSVHSQFEDRAYRMGQTHDTVVCLYLHAAGTIDDWNLEILEKKRLVTSEIMDGETDTTETITQEDYDRLIALLKNLPTQ
jgi:SNF2 family DNA or RNA helicase